MCETSYPVFHVKHFRGKNVSGAYHPLELSFDKGVRRVFMSFYGLERYLMLP